jgi:hypothetical protein
MDGQSGDYMLTLRGAKKQNYDDLTKIQQEPGLSRVMLPE